MKKCILFFIFLFFLSQISFADEVSTMKMEDFLYNQNEKRWDELSLNDKNQVIYKGKVILSGDNVPLTNETAIRTNEILMIIKANKIKPRFLCNPKNTAKNGVLGCYIDSPNK